MEANPVTKEKLEKLANKDFEIVWNKYVKAYPNKSSIKEMARTLYVGGYVNGGLTVYDICSDIIGGVNA